MAGRKACSGWRIVKLIDTRNPLIYNMIGGPEAFGTRSALATRLGRRHRRWSGSIGDGEDRRFS